MNTVMVRKAALDLRWTTLWYCLGTVVYGMVMVGFYPTIEKNAQDFQDMIAKYPEPLKKAFGISDFVTLAGFLGGEFLNLVWPMIAAAFVIMAGTAVVAQEIERGTIEFWLSVPAGRAGLLVSKLTALLGSIATLVAATAGSLWIGAVLIGKSFAPDHVLAMALVMLIFVVTIASISVLFSTVFSARGPAAGVAAAVALASYLAWVMAGLNTSWEWLRRISLFTPFKPQDALSAGSIDWLGLLVLIGISAACLLAALTRFNRRDAIG